MLSICKHTLKFRTSALSRTISFQRHFTSYLSDIKDGPKPALALGAAGLIPFVSAPAILICGGDVTLLKGLLPIVSQGQLAYGAIILSFLGGVRWGKLAAAQPCIQPSWGQFIWSVTPSLIAWPALLVPSQLVSVLMVVSGLGVCGYLDMKQSGYQPWFKGLRLVLTTVAILSLLLTLLLSNSDLDKRKQF